MCANTNRTIWQLLLRCIFVINVLQGDPDCHSAYQPPSLVAFASHGKVPDGFKDGDLLDPGFFDDHSATVSDQYNLPAMNDNGSASMGGGGGGNIMGDFMNKVSKCIFDEIEANGVSQESGDLMNYMTSDAWIDVAEYGTKQEFTDTLGDAIDPLTSKLMDAYGPDIIGSMPSEMHQWIRDSTILWIKN